MQRSQFLTLAVVCLLVQTGWAQQYQQVFSLLKRCPCVQINTCYSEEINLEVQQYLNSQFRCPESTHQHCCGPIYPTLGYDGHFDEQSRAKSGAPVEPSVNENVVVILAQSVTPSKEEAQGRAVEVMTVLPQTEAPVLTTTTVDNDDGSPEPSTALIEDTTTQIPVTTTTVQSTTRGRLSRFHQRRPFPRYERGSTESTSSRAPIQRRTTASRRNPATSESPRRSSTQTGLYNSEFKRRVTNRQRNEPTISTIESTE
ncbi:uncharacterized protein LOC131437215 [Malaya genurostris]|uniref:uncharacterized protein LOC131437215 n=1 Tax=Malaya genurostris TaxID=325434 RepID=UPI0026F3D7B8|nr:uncharacterized protein LOC131437215 [Malaya genurostris]